MSRFQIHDEETAPERSAAVLRGALSSGGELPHVLGVLAGAPAALRAYARFRSELRHGTLSSATHARIALAVAERHGASSEVGIHARAGRAAGLSHDEVLAARSFSSGEPAEAALLEYLRVVIDEGRPAMHVHESTREAGWSEEALIEAIAAASLAGFTATLTVAGEVPADTPFGAQAGTVEALPQLRAA